MASSCQGGHKGDSRTASCQHLEKAVLGEMILPIDAARREGWHQRPMRSIRPHSQSGRFAVRVVPAADRNILVHEMAQSRLSFTLYWRASACHLESANPSC